ncbi:hypothetical protein HMPREF9370_1025 [Neisseria wadsworthii 9715]|uniref:Uncharacterized protein n=1 Tax=Neisseria wadsworthii 9715 TaxID=1030841 RepID=G4CPL5_9NEIS|nr:hypothetical protein HMPREF9370_1025 [Neisseria wadsworthii 9715]
MTAVFAIQRQRFFIFSKCAANSISTKVFYSFSDRHSTIHPIIFDNKQNNL